MASQTVLEMLQDAFPGQYAGTSTKVHNFYFGPGSRSGTRLYVRQTELNEARVLYKHLVNLPNGYALKNYVDSPVSGVRIHQTKKRDDCVFERRHINRLIAILKGRN